MLNQNWIQRIAIPLIEYTVIFIGFFYTVITGYDFFLNPIKWINNGWRIIFPFTAYQYEPMLHDVFFFGIFLIIIYIQRGRTAVIGFFWVCTFFEFTFNWTNISEWTLFESIDYYFYFKLTIFTALFVVACLTVYCSRYEINITIFNIFIWCIFFLIFTVDQHIPIPLVQTIFFLGISYDMVGGKVGSFTESKTT